MTRVLLAECLFTALMLAAATTSPDAKQKTPPLEIVPDKTADTIEGYWSCEGRELPDGAYTGVVVIRKHKSVYLASWSVGLSAYQGIGLRTGDTLSVYKLVAGELRGTWTSLPGSGERNQETLTWLKALR